MSLGFWNISTGSKIVQEMGALGSSKTHLLFLLGSHHSPELGKQGRLLLSQALTQLTSHLGAI